MAAFERLMLPTRWLAKMFIEKSLPAKVEGIVLEMRAEMDTLVPGSGESLPINSIDDLDSLVG